MQPQLKSQYLNPQGYTQQDHFQFDYSSHQFNNNYEDNNFVGNISNLQSSAPCSSSSIEINRINKSNQHMFKGILPYNH